MPKVPVFQGRVGVRPDAPNYSNLKPDMSGVVMGEALEKVGGAVQGIASTVGGIAGRMLSAEDKLAQAAKDYRREKADLQFSEAVNRKHYGQGEGFLNLEGEGALDYSAHMKALQKTRQEIAKSLPGDDDRQWFELRAEARSQQAKAAWDKHVTTQLSAVREQVAGGALGQALEAIRNSDGNPDVLFSETSKLFVGPDTDGDGNPEPGVFRKWMMSKGLPVDAIAEREREITSRLAAEAMKGFLDKGDGVGAHNFFRYPGVKERLGKLADDFEAKIKPVLDAQEGKREALEALEGSRTPRGWVDEGGAKAKVAGIENEGIRAEATKRLADLFRDAREEKKRAIDSVFDRALGSYLSSKRPSDMSAADIQFLRDGENDPEAYVKLERIIEADQEKARAAREGRGLRKPTEQEQRNLASLIFNVDRFPEKYVGMDETQLRREVLSELAPSDHDRAAQLVGGLQKRMRDPQEKLSQTATAYLTKLGQDQKHFGKGRQMSKWTAEEVERFVVAQAEMLDLVNNYRATNAKSPPHDVVQKWAAELLVKRPVKGSGWFGTDFRADEEAPLDRVLAGKSETFEPTPEQEQDIEYPARTGAAIRSDYGWADIPTADRASIRARLMQELGRTPTKGEVKAAYSAQLEGSIEL